MASSLSIRSYYIKGFCRIFGAAASSSSTMTTRVGLPRTATWLREGNPFKRVITRRCTRHAASMSSTWTRQFAVAAPQRQSKDNIDPPTIPDLTHRPRIDLNEFLGPPGWKIDDLLPPSRHPRSPPTDTPNDASAPTKSEISSQTLHHLLQLSALPQPSSPAEEEKLLSALHDQLHFVRHVQSVPTEDVPPLSRIGYEPRPDNDIGVLTFDECIEATKAAADKAASWKQWSVMDLPGGSRLGREEGYFVVVSKSKEPVEDRKESS